MLKRRAFSTLCKAASSSGPTHRSSRKRRCEREETQEEDGPSISSPEKHQQKQQKKKRRARKAMAPSIQEERSGRFIPSPNASVRERISRAFTHRLYLIERKVIGSPDAPSACEFFVLGATGNVYTVKLQTSPSCTCPDFARGNTCKHILFVMLRVLKLPTSDPRVWQKALLSSELNDLLHLSSINQAVLASQLVRQRFQEIVGGKNEADVKVEQREVEGDCPICYEKLADDNGKALEPVVFCKSCGNNVHKDCFKRWSRSKGARKVTCIYCRALWHDNKKNKNPDDDEIGEGGYVNLASYSEVHQNEDLSLEALYPETSRWFERRGRR